MKPIKWIESCEHLGQSLGLDEERSDELYYRIRLIVHEATRPLKKGEEPMDSGTFVKMCIAIAKTEAELAFCSYIAGMHVAKLWDTEEYAEYEEED